VHFFITQPPHSTVNGHSSLPSHPSGKEIGGKNTTRSFCMTMYYARLFHFQISPTLTFERTFRHSFISRVHTSSLSNMLSQFASSCLPALLGLERHSFCFAVGHPALPLANRVRFGLTEYPASHVKNGSLSSSLKYSKMLSVVVFLVLCDLSFSATP